MVRVCLLLCCATVSMAATVRLPIAADTNVSSYAAEVEYSYGARSAARVKGIEMFYLAMPDLRPLAQQRVAAARFWFKPVGRHQLYHVGFSTIAAAWAEDAGRGEQDPDGTCFVRRRLPDGQTAPWAADGGDFTDVAFCAGQTIVSYDTVRAEADGWLSAALDPAILAAVATGESAGFCFSDESGQTRANNDIYCREQSNAAPYLQVETIAAAPARATISEVQVSTAPAAASLTGGAAKLSFLLGADAADLPWLRLDLMVNGQPWPRYLTPRPQVGANTVILRELAGGQPVAVQVRVGDTAVGGSGAASPALQPIALPAVTRDADPAPDGPLFVVPGYCSVHPVSGNVLEEVGPAKYGGPAAGEYRRRNPVWDAAGVHLAAAVGETVAIQVIGPLDVDDISLRGTPPGIDVEAYSIWYVPDPEPVGELAIDLGMYHRGMQELPRQRYWSLLLEFQVGTRDEPGTYRTELSYRGEHRVPLEFTVWKHRLPPELGFDVSLNSYGSVNGQFGIGDPLSDEGLAVERDYHRLAHDHRLTWAPLTYGQSGRVEPGAGPELSGEGAGTRCDFAAFDKRFGPLLDGSAFHRNRPRDGVPLDHLYLPFHENWPGSITDYRWSPTATDYAAMIAEHATAPPIGEAFPQAYQDRFRAVARQFAEHVRDKGWDRTQLQVYLNNKYNFRDPQQGGRGTSWWLLDEPMHRDDWLALRFFADLLRQAVPDRTLQMRADISRPQWQRDWLDSLLDLDVVGNAWFQYRDRTAAWVESQGAHAWVYGSANAVGQPNTQAVAWCLKAWLSGADGVVPWNSIGGDGNFEKASQTALMLPAKRFGHNLPVASLRLKALRSGQQEAERLRLLAKQTGATREQIAAAVAPLLDLSAASQSRGGEDAGWLAFDRVTPEALERLRQAVAAKLELGG